jgi:3-isopropylmalate dehydrogenase
MKKTCGLFARTCREVAKEYPDIAFDELYVDAASMRLIKEPETFDVLVTPNMFGDILSDEAAQLVGGLGMAPGANIGEDFGLFEPIHGSAPDIAGKQLANPISMILASKMMLEWLSEKYKDSECFNAAKIIQNAVKKSLSDGLVIPGMRMNLLTSEIGDVIVDQIYRVH